MGKTVKERDVRKYLRDQAIAKGMEHRKLGWIAKRNAPDEIIMHNGAHFIECKAPGKEPTQAQAREHERMRSKGCSVFVVANFEEVDYVLDIIENRAY